MTTAVRHGSVAETRRQIREALVDAGGVIGDGRSVAAASPPLPAPFAAAAPVEGSEISEVAVGAAPATSRDAAFADGIQRYVVEGRIGITPIVFRWRDQRRGHVLSATDRRWWCGARSG